MQQLHKREGVSIKTLPMNTEKFRTLTINSFDLIDSYMFLAAPLNVLVDNLVTSQNKFVLLDQLKLYDASEKELKQLLLRKGILYYYVKLHLLLYS